MKNKINLKENRIKTTIMVGAFFLVILIILSGCDKTKMEQPQIPNNEKKPSPVYTKDPLVLSVVRNMEAPVPEELEMPRATVIGKYLYECNLLSSMEKTNCYDEYYRNNYKELYEKRAECSLNEEECLNEYYLLASGYGGTTYCEAITSNELKEECLLKVE